MRRGLKITQSSINCNDEHIEFLSFQQHASKNPNQLDRERKKNYDKIKFNFQQQQKQKAE